MADIMKSEDDKPLSGEEQFALSHYLDELIMEFQDVLDPNDFHKKFNHLEELCTKLQERITSSNLEDEDKDDVIKLCKDELVKIKQKYKEFINSLSDLSQNIAKIEDKSFDKSDLDRSAQLAEAFDQSTIPIFKKYAKALDIAINYYAENGKPLNDDEIDIIALAARDFDRSNDPILIKQASVLDELLLTLSAPKDYISNYKIAEEAEIQKLMSKNRELSSEHLYKDVKKKLDEHNKVADTAKAVSKIKEYRPLEAPLSTRYCPDHPGVSVVNIGNYTVQCPLDYKTYNWMAGFETMKGNKIPGGSVEYQTPDYGSSQDGQMMFDTRESLMTRAADAYLDVLEKKIS